MSFTIKTCTVCGLSWGGDYTPRESRLELHNKLAYGDGSGFCYRFYDPDHRLLVWFSKRHHEGLWPGAVVRAIFTVQRHEIYNGEHEGVINKFSYVVTGNLTAASVSGRAKGS